MSDFHFVGHFCKPKKTMRFLKSIDKRAPATEADVPVEVPWLRMNLNTLLRYDVFNCGIGILPVEKNTSNGTKVGSVNHTQAGSLCHNMVDYIADRIADESEIRRGKQFPYQYFAAYLNADDHVPQEITELRSVKAENSLVMFVCSQTSSFIVKTSFCRQPEACEAQVRRHHSH